MLTCPRFLLVFLRGGNQWVDLMNSRINDRCLHQSTEVRGHLFKSQGGTEGPYGPGKFQEMLFLSTPEYSHTSGDFSKLTNWPACTVRPWSSKDMYAETYGRKTHDNWAPHEPLDNFIEDLWAMRYGISQCHMNRNPHVPNSGETELYRQSSRAIWHPSSMQIILFRILSLCIGILLCA